MTSKHQQDCPMRTGGDACTCGFDDLEAIVEWIDEHGWDQLNSPAFTEWLQAKGIDKSRLTLAQCRMPEWS